MTFISHSKYIYFKVYYFCNKYTVYFSVSHWNSNYKDILQSETVGGQNNPWCG